MDGDRNKVLRVGFLTPVTDLDPHHASDYAGHAVLSQIFETPFTVKAEGAIEPVLFAEHLVDESAGAGEVYVGRVRPGIQFSDGTELTAAQVASSFRRGLRTGDHTRVEVEGDRVRFRLAEAQSSTEKAAFWSPASLRTTSF